METIIKPVVKVMENTIVNRAHGRDVLNFLNSRIETASNIGHTEIKIHGWVGTVYAFNSWGNIDCDSLGHLVERYLDTLGFNVSHCADELVIRWN